jgi:hypothetical protein
MVKWVKKNKSEVTSIIIWTYYYIPHQSLIVRQKKHHQMFLTHYLKLNSYLINIKSVINIANKSEEEINYHITRTALNDIENELYDQKKLIENTSRNDEPLSKNQGFLEDVFISNLGMELIKEKHPDYGFYSMSPNFLKIQKMVNQEAYKLFDIIKKLNDTK